MRSFNETIGLRTTNRAESHCLRLAAGRRRCGSVGILWRFEFQCGLGQSVSRRRGGGRTGRRHYYPRFRRRSGSRSATGISSARTVLRRHRNHHYPRAVLYDSCKSVIDETAVPRALTLQPQRPFRQRVWRSIMSLWGWVSGIGTAKPTDSFVNGDFGVKPNRGPTWSKACPHCRNVSGVPDSTVAETRRVGLTVVPCPKCRQIVGLIASDSVAKRAVEVQCPRCASTSPSVMGMGVVTRTCRQCNHRFPFDTGR